MYGTLGIILISMGAFNPTERIIGSLDPSSNGAAWAGPRGCDEAAWSVELALRDRRDGDGVIDLDVGEIGEMEIVLRITAFEEVPGAVASCSAFFDEFSVNDEENMLEGVVAFGLPPPWTYSHCADWSPSDTSFALDDYCLIMFDDNDCGGVTALDGTVELVLHTVAIRGEAEGTYEITFERGALAPWVFGAGPTYVPYPLCDPCVDSDCADDPATLLLGVGNPSDCAASAGPLIVNIVGCHADLNADDLVDPLDSGLAQALFGCAVGTGDADCDAADANRDGQVDPLDVGFILSRFGPCFGTLPLQATERVSVHSDGTEANATSWSPALSDDGRIASFESSADNLVDNDVNGKFDIFVHDRETGLTTRVSVHSNGTESNGDSYDPSLSGDGRYVAFSSSASNLVDGPFSSKVQVFVHDRQTGTTERVSVSSSGIVGTSNSLEPSISADGRFVAFASYAANLVVGDTNGDPDVFVHDRQTATTERVSVRSDGTQVEGLSFGGSISDDGCRVAFQSSADDLVEDDDGAHTDVFVRDRCVTATIRVSVTVDGLDGDGYSHDALISADGHVVVFSTDAGNLAEGGFANTTQVVAHDLESGISEVLSLGTGGLPAMGDSIATGVSGDGRFVTFYSSAYDLVEGDQTVFNDVFLRDRDSGTTQMLSVGFDGQPADYYSYSGPVSSDGAAVVFYSYASNLIDQDLNGFQDVFVVDLGFPK